jgi:hypothetical protein
MIEQNPGGVTKTSKVHGPRGWWIPDCASFADQLFNERESITSLAPYLLGALGGCCSGHTAFLAVVPYFYRQKFER